MKAQLLSIAILSASLAACGGGGGGGGSTPPPTTPDPAKPMLQVKGITGINYTIGDRSGIVEAGKAIEYVSGEDITFSLGKLTIATVAAKDEITMADMFSTLPDNAKNFRAALRQYYNVSMSLQTSPRNERLYKYGAVPALHRASNIMQLLVAMDGDDDISNGIDLTTGNWATKLASLDENTLPVNGHLAFFDNQPRVRAFSQQHDLPLNMDIGAPLTALYQLVGKNISVKPVVGYKSEGISPAVTVDYTFTAAMQLEKTEIRTSSSASVTTLSYDDTGNITRSLSENDTNADGNRDNHRIDDKVFNAYGTLTKRDFKSFFNSNNPVSSNTVTTYTPLANKALWQNFTSRNQLNNTANYVVTSYTYNESGLQTEDKGEQFDANDNLLGTAKLYSYTYADNQIATATINSYSNTVYRGKSEFSYAFSDQQNQSTETEFDANNAPFGTSIQITEKFNDQSRLTEKTFEVKNNDVLTQQQKAIFIYDNSGRLTSCTMTTDNNGNGTVDFQRRETKTYDSNGVTSFTFERDADVDGTYTDQETTNIVYGDQGEIKSEDGNNFANYIYSDTDAANGVAYLVHELMLIDDELLGNSCFLSNNF